MNPFRALENVIAGLVEGTFGRVFRSEVRPMEIAHKLAREMDEHATASVSRTYAPNEYSVWLSPGDRARYEGVEHEVIEELCAYLLEHARGESFALASAPQISFHTDEDLALGEFGIEARMAQPQPEQDERAQRADRREGGQRADRREGGQRAAQPKLPEAGRPASPRRAAAVGPSVELGAQEPGGTMIFSNAARVRGAVEGARPPRQGKAFLLMAGRRLIVPPSGGVVGRSRD